MNSNEQISFPRPTELEIRSQFALATVYARCSLGGEYTLRGWALNEARELAFRLSEVEESDVPCPILFRDEELLVSAWEQGLQRAADKRYRWFSKDNLPEATMLRDLLARGQRCQVNGHSLSPDEHGVWITNAYGIDCGLWQDLDLKTIEAFLVNMASDKNYGPTPH